MTAETNSARVFSRGAWWKLGLCAALGGVFGYVVAASGLDNGLELTVSQLFAALAALVYGLSGVLALFGALSPRLGLAMKMFDDHDAWRDERAMMQDSGIGCLLFSLSVWLLLAVQPLGWLPTGLGGGLTAALALAACGFTWRTWRAMDELWRKVSAEAAELAFYLLFAVGAVWSAAAHLQLVAAPAPIDWITMLLVASLIASIAATARRGMIRNAL